jgi:hypothetical protein
MGGQHDIHGTKYEGTPKWLAANTYYKLGQGSFALDKGIPPLHQWQRGSCDAQPGNVWLNPRLSETQPRVPLAVSRNGCRIS